MLNTLLVVFRHPAVQFMSAGFILFMIHAWARPLQARRARSIGTVALVLQLVFSWDSAAVAASETAGPGGARTELACRALTDTTIADTSILSATVVDGDAEPIPAASLRYAKSHALRPEDRPPLPDYCRVRGVVRPAINFELRLPTADWNGKFFMAGCGGFCGQVLPERLGQSNGINEALARNYAVVTTDAGHWSAHAADGLWAYNNRAAERDWAWRVIPEVARAAKEIIRAFFGRGEERSYFSGCSNGGRMGAMATQRFPELFDGVLIGAPALDWRTLAMHGAWTIQSNTGADGEPILGPNKVGLVAAAVMAACDATDGLADGLIADPPACDFDAKSLQCEANEDGGQCLTAAEVGVLEKWYGGLPDGHGVDWKYNLAHGSEPYWPAWLIPPGGRKGIMVVYLENLFSYILFERDPGPAYSLLDFDLSEYPAALDFMRPIYRADNPDLSRFHAAGGKAIMWQGWSDPGAAPGAAIGYYEDAVELAGGKAAADEFLRLFLIPGAGHCFEAPHQSAERFDPLAAIEAWVEQGVAPDAMIARQVGGDGAAIRSRPLCPYPKVARYTGGGDTNDAGNFRCEAP